MTPRTDLFVYYTPWRADVLRHYINQLNKFTVDKVVNILNQLKVQGDGNVSNFKAMNLLQVDKGYD
jgi:hypothetical protein